LKAKDMTLCAFFAAITAICSLISVPIGISAVPFSLGIIGVMLSGSLLKPLPALISQLIYLLLGIIGLPVFSQFQAGFSVIAGHTGGYLAAYPVMALVIALLLKSKKSRKYITVFFPMLVSLIICYLIGCVWLAFSTGITFQAALISGAVPFIIPDIIKTVLAALLSVAVYKALRKNPGSFVNH